MHLVATQLTTFSVWMGIADFIIKTLSVQKSAGTI